MAKQPSKGKCNLCGQTYDGTAMGRHLKSCAKAKGCFKAAEEADQQAADGLFHILVRDGTGIYWMHLAVPLNTRLTQLDRFLRDIWLECCGHMSAFHIEGARYGLSADQELGFKSMSVPAGRVLSVGMKFGHEYDFGSTTELELKVVGMIEGATPGGKIQLLARNDPPEITCEVCDNAPATEVCSDCIWSQGAWLCEVCADDHDCGIEMLLPVVNSPRVGTCAYTGSETDS